MEARIYQPCKTATQSGKANTQHWLFELITDQPLFTEPLMGWVGSSDTTGQKPMKFPSKETAIAYAKKQGLAYTVIEPQKRKTIIKSYADNFSD